MPDERVAIFPGSFDPITLGHVDVVGRATALFDRVIIAVLVNAAKSPWFSVEERIALIRASVAGIERVEVEAYGGLRVDFVRARRAVAVVRGLRTAAEFSDEWQIALTNRHLNPACETVFVMPSAAHLFVSSRLVREVASHGGSLDGLVPVPVSSALAARRTAGGAR